jgi:hypothetical protein
MRWPRITRTGPPVANPSPPLFVPGPLNDRLWHIPFNRVDTVPEQLVRGREGLFFGYEFAIQTGNGRKLPDDVVHYYVRLLSSPDALRGCFGLYRAWDATLAQNEPRTTRPLTMPALAIGGAASWGDAVGHVAAHDVPDRGHPRHRPLGRRDGSRGDAGGADRIPGPSRDGG